MCIGKEREYGQNAVQDRRLKMKIRILKNFSYGSVSDPQKMLAGNVQEVPSGVSESFIETWLEMGWVEKVE